MEPGTKVEVRSRYDRMWARGFEIAERVDSDDGTQFKVRRRSDGQVLPALFDEEDLREERRKRSMWWY